VEFHQDFRSHHELLDTKTFCMDCRREIFLYFAYEDGMLKCLKFLKAPQKTSIFRKWKVADIQELLTRVRNWRENSLSQEIPVINGLCNGNFMGTVSYCMF
jgi:hypothetical protein